MMAKFSNIILTLLIFLGIFSSSRSASVQDILNDPKAIQKGIACVLDRGPCVGYGKALKGSIKEVLVNDCRACNAKQKLNARKVIEFMEQNHKQEWNQILHKYRSNPATQGRNF